MDQTDLFLPALGDVRARTVQDFMTHNWFALHGGTKRTEPITHKVGDTWVTVRGTADLGIATLYDADLLFFLISTLQQNIDDGQPITNSFSFSFWDFAKFRQIKNLSGKRYADIWEAIKRLTTTTIQTNIPAYGERIIPLLAGGAKLEEDLVMGPKFPTQYYRVELAPFVYDAVANQKRVLSISKDYFRIRGMLRRFLFLYARKSIGQNKSEWKESLETFMPKTATLSSRKEFRRMIRTMTEKPILNYTVRLDDEDNIIFQNHQKRK